MKTFSYRLGEKKIDLEVIEILPNSHIKVNAFVNGEEIAKEAVGVICQTIDIPYKLLLQIGNISLTLCNLKDARNISKSREIADWLWKNAFNYDRFALVYKFTTEYAANWTDKEPLNELSSTLKKLRHSIRLSQEKFAKYLEIPFRTYQNWETGHRVPPKYLVKLIEYKIEREAKIRREK